MSILNLPPTLTYRAAEAGVRALDSLTYEEFVDEYSEELYEELLEAIEFYERNHYL